ncbi:MAG: zf-HC2 domain-containing protein [Gemmatimonadetes bacterium]|nr:zf-HC2 domain-containing protein [Gemmatimonadota bacterium]
MNAKRCDGIRQRLADFDAGLLDERRAAEVTAHVVECEACGTELAALQGTAALLDATDPARPSHDLWPGVAEKLAPRSLGRQWWRPLVIPRRRWLEVAVVAAIVIVLALILYPVNSGPPPGILPHAVDEDAALFAQWHAESSLASGLADRYSVALVVLDESRKSPESR